MKKSAYHDSRATVLIKPVTLTTGNANGAGVDLLGYSGALITVQTGISGATLGASNLVLIRFVSSTDNSTFANCNDTTDLIGGNHNVTIDANAEANSTHQRAYIGSARYVTVYAECTGTVSVPISAEVIRIKPHHGPIA